MGRVQSRLVEGDFLSIGKVFGEAGQFQLLESDTDEKDASARIEGDITVLGVSYLGDTELAAGSGITAEDSTVTIGSSGVPISQIWVGRLSISTTVEGSTTNSTPTIAYANAGFSPMWDGIGTQVSTMSGALDKLQPFMGPPIRISSSDAVPGQANTYYIDKASSQYGHNVALDSSGTPLIRVLLEGQELMWGPVATFGNEDNVDFDIVRSLSTGAEGYAAVGSTNAIKFNGTMDGHVWLYYHKKGLATA
jgi:hypothetical protein